MNPLPRTGSSLIDSMLFAVGAICFTLAVGLVVLVGALVIQATMLLSEPYVGSRSASSVLALVAFAAYVGVPSYLIATYADDPEGRDDAADPDDAADRRAQSADEQAVTADLGEELRNDGADSADGPGDGHRHEAARCDGPRPDGERNDQPDGEGP